MAPTTPYTPDLDGREPVEAMRHTAAAVARLVASWSPADFERPYAPGKWTAREVLVHLLHSELALGTRARMALTSPGYVAQPFDQDRLMAVDGQLSGPDAANAFVALAAANASLYASLTEAERQTPYSHPEFGALTVDWNIHHQAGHQLHHLRQLEALG